MQTFTLNPPIPMTGALAVEGSPAMATIYVDNEMVGKTPMIVNQLLAGKHTVRVEKEGYKSVTKEVVVEESKEHLVKYELTKLAASPTVKPLANSGTKPSEKTTMTAAKKPTVNLRGTLPANMQESIAKAAKDTKKEPALSSKSKKQTLILANGATSFKSQLWGVGLMIGRLHNGYGWYVKGRSNFQGVKTLSGVQCDATGAIVSGDNNPFFDYNGDGVNDAGVVPFYSGKTKASEWMVSAGFTMDFLTKKVLRNKNSVVGLYAGLGYGEVRYAWETADGNWIKYAPWSVAGVTADAGLIGSVGGFTMALGFSTINFKHMELEASIGWTF